MLIFKTKVKSMYAERNQQRIQENVLTDVITQYLNDNKDCLLYLGTCETEDDGLDPLVYSTILEPNPDFGKFKYGDQKVINGELRKREGLECFATTYTNALNNLSRKIKPDSLSYNYEISEDKLSKNTIDKIIKRGINFYIKSKGEDLEVLGKICFREFGNITIFSNDFKNLYEMNRTYNLRIMPPEIIDDIKKGIQINRKIKDIQKDSKDFSFVSDKFSIQYLTQNFFTQDLEQVRNNLIEILKPFKFSKEASDGLLVWMLLSDFPFTRE